jgi:hypothetical protein
MAQAMDKSTVQDAPAAEKRIEELESVLRIVLEQINTHQIYDKDARGLIRRALSSTLRTGPPAPVRQQGEFPSFFPSSPSNFI